MSPKAKPLICYLCGDEIPTGWPVAWYGTDKDGNLTVMHRFRNMCVTPPSAVESNEKGDKKK